ncbi:putative secreted protein [Corynebacterium variabile DSM 44702]|uniref:Putative secreted protein n=1 Tax=Corynebacterium variabile (strain DSM 44702 / CIP 107183 / JCM 12073 / NCIMB 30131) TaxID=858619 RepID=G0HHJ8_CORVD|nr:hypothetical protein [Corynebacterium variabile]AEK37718.1 putative secreted protein [Corynebacterium variabile DSM 44702]
MFTIVFPVSSPQTLQGEHRSIKKSLITVGTVASVAVAGTGVAVAGTGVAVAGTGVAAAATAADNETPTGSAVLGSIQSSTSDGALDPTGSIDAHGFFNQFWAKGQDGVIDGAGVIAILTGVAGAAASVYGIANAYTAVIDASDAHQGVINDTLGFLAQQGIKF